MVGRVNYGSLPFKEQIEYFRQKLDLPSERWADVWKEAHNRAFTVAGAMSDDLLADFRQAVDTAIAQGKSLGWFQSQFNDIVKKYGWDFNGEASWRSQLIYETNLRQSYSAGREQQIQEIKHLRPYGIYKHTDQEHPRLEHLSWNNLVLPLDDPWWETHTPINGYHCKCKKFTADQRTLDRLGLKVSASPTVEYYDWVDKVTGEVHRIPKGIDPSFDYTPRTPAELTAHVTKQIEKKPPVAERLTARVVDSAFSTVKGVSAENISAVLEQLNSPELELFKKAMSKHSFKSLIVKQSEMTGGTKARAIASDVEAYLQSGRPQPVVLYMHRAPSRVNGFTSRRWDHVVVKAKSTDSLKKVQASDITAAIEAVMSAMEAGRRSWSMSAMTKELVGDSARVLTTWTHEIGHLVHFKAGAPTPPRLLELTNYSQASEFEWFAEHFVAWLFAPSRLKADYPEIYDFINDTVAGIL